MKKIAVESLPASRFTGHAGSLSLDFLKSPHARPPPPRKTENEQPVNPLHPATPPAECFPLRCDRLRALLASRSGLPVEALLVSNPVNVTWLTGFTGDSSYLLFGTQGVVLISDFRFVTQLSGECPGLETWIRPPEMKLHEAAAKVIVERKLQSVGFESNHLTQDSFTKIAAAATNVEWTPFDAQIEELRAVKDAWELEELRYAVHLAARGFDYFRAILTPTMTERESAADLEQAVRRFGGEKLAFPPIIGVGDRGAMPHYRAGDRYLREAPTLLIDWGVLSRNGYHSDLTRMLVTGTPSAEYRRVYEIVLAAQQHAIAAIRPGASCREIDAIARNFIHDAGYGNRFGHSLGHGIGLDIHEQPRFSPSSLDVLQPGMVVTVEPGIYIPGDFGVRIEDDILVTEDGHEVLSSVVPKDYDSTWIRW